MKLKIISLIATLLILHLSSLAFAAEKDSEFFDHSHRLWTEVLSEFVVQDGASTSVNYQALKSQPEKLEQYLLEISQLPQSTYQSFSSEQKLAFLINAYNAYTVKLIVDNYPITSIKKLGGLFSSPWKIKFFQLLGKQQSLDDIEHGIIRKNFKEPRIHFAVNCASIGCPALQAEAYAANKLDAQLDKASRDFLSDRSRNFYDKKKNTLFLSPIFKWYSEDFKAIQALFKPL